MSQTFGMSKAELRRTIRGRLALLSPDAAARMSARTVSHVLGSAFWARARSVMIYLPVGPTSRLAPEVDISGCIAPAIATGKRVFAPRIDWEQSLLIPVELTGPDHPVEVRRYDVPEPIGEAVPGAAVATIDLVVTPGLAFDPTGGRLGRGGGFYDRFLGGFTPSRPGLPVRLGVCFGVQIVDRVPREPHDALMHGVATELGVLDVHA